MDGWLATIGSQEDNSKIAELLGSDTDAWIGASDSLVIKGLTNGDRYIVEMVTDTTNHRDSVKLYEASESGAKGKLINIDSIGVPASVNHQLLPVSEMAIGGLEAGNTYYVSDASVDEFKLKEKPNDADTLVLSGTDPMGQGEIGRNGFIGYMGIDLGIIRDNNGNIVVNADGDDILDDVGEGSQQLMFALSSQTSGIQSLPYIKLGPRAASDGTGTASSHVHSVGGSLVAQSVRPKATSTANPVVTITLAAGSHLHAAEDIDITAISAGNAVTKGEGYGGALLASGAGTTAASSVSHAAKVNLFGSLTTNADLTIEAKVSDDVEAHADTKSYGALDANANSEATINNAFDAVITFDQNARLAAGKNIEVNAITSIEDQLTSTTHSGALFGSSKANQNVDADGNNRTGIQIVENAGHENRTAIYVNHADLFASEEIILNSVVRDLNTAPAKAGSEVIQAFGGGMQNANQATGIVNVIDTALVSLGDGARLISRDVNLSATHGKTDGLGESYLVDLYTRSHTRRGRAASRADASVNFDSNSRIESNADAIVHADVLLVNADQGVDDTSFDAVAETDRASSNVTETTTATIDRNIDWNANVYGRGRARLEVDATGAVTRSDGVVLNNGTKGLQSVYAPGETIEVSGLTFDFVEQQSSFSVSPVENPASLDGTASVSGDALFYDQVHVELKNYSSNDMRLRDLNLADYSFDDSSTDKQFWSGGPAGSGGSSVDNRYSNWNAGEPNNSGGVENNAQLRTDGKWNDLAGTSSLS